MPRRVKEGREQRRGTLRRINFFIYLVSGIIGFALLAKPVHGWRIALREPVTYQPDLPALWAVVAAFTVLCVSLLVVFARALGGRRPSRGWAAVAFSTAGLLLFLRLGQADQGLSPHLPGLRVGDTISELGEGLAAILKKTGRYPDALEESAVLAGRETGWRSHGRELPYRLVSERGSGARLAARQGDLPGTVYYVVSPDGSRFWMTGLVLVGAPTGRLDFLRDERGAPFIFTRSVSGADLSR